MGKVSRAAAITTAAVSVSLALSSAASADIAIYVHGALPPGTVLSQTDILRRIPPGYTLQEIEYPGGLWPWTGLLSATGAQSIAVGVSVLDQAIQAAEAQGKVLVIGESLGSLVVDQELRNLTTQSYRPDPAQVRFEVIADPSRPGGLVSYIPYGWPDPLTFTLSQPVPETPYDVAVLKLQYDGVASWPDRPWRLVSVANAIAGGIVYHGTDHYGLMARSIINGTFPTEDVVTEVNSQGGVTTTYTGEQTPALLHLLETVFPQTVAFMDVLLTPLINAGYSELTPDLGPHLAPGGALVNRNGDPIFGRSAAPVPRPATVRPSTARAVSGVAVPQPAASKRAAPKRTVPNRAAAGPQRTRN